MSWFCRKSGTRRPKGFEPLRPINESKQLPDKTNSVKNVKQQENKRKKSK
jgi:hypothetical protein